MAEMDYPAVRVTLDGGDNLEVASFEQAFGEHSNLHGKGRARRAARKDARQRKRMNRINNRMSRKTARKVGRQQVRTAKMMAKQDRKNARLENRLNRKAMRKAANEPDELPEDELTSQEMQGDDDGYSPEEQTPHTNQSANDDYPDNSSSGEVDGESDAYPADTDERDIEDSVQDDGSDEGYDDESSFIGDDFESDFVASEAAGEERRVNPKLKELMRRIEWNKIVIAGLKKEMANGGNTADIQARLDNRTQRLAELQAKLQSFSNARGGRGGASRKAVRAARREARKEMHAERKMIRQQRRSRTPVDSELSPEISNNRIDVPASDTHSSEFSGGKTGIIGIDQVGEVDSPNTRMIELKSGADGSGGVMSSGLGKGLFYAGIAALALLVLSQAGKKSHA